MQPRDLLLLTLFRHVINEPNAEAGCECFQSITGRQISDQAFHAVVAAALRDRLVREPVRLPEGALQCHWHLELTPSGVAEARRLKGACPDR